jgi:hypothetical protein
MVAEWHHFATSHGKGLCSGVGGTVNHMTTNCMTPHQLIFFHIGTIYEQESALLSNINGASASE